MLVNIGDEGAPHMFTYQGLILYANTPPRRLLSHYQCAPLLLGQRHLETPGWSETSPPSHLED